MIGRIGGLLLVAWSGITLLKFAVRGFLSSTQGNAPYGHEAAYSGGYAVGQGMAFVFAVLMLLAGLFLLFGRSYSPNPRSGKKRKRRKIVTPTGFKD